MSLKIRQERIQRRWTQGFAARQIGMTKAAYRNIETGQRKPSYDVLIKLLDLFDYNDPRKLFASMECEQDRQKTRNPDNENKITGIRKFDVPKIAKEVGQILARYAVPASIREKVFDYVRADHDFHAVIPYIQSKEEQD